MNEKEKLGAAAPRTALSRDLGKCDLYRDAHEEYGSCENWRPFEDASASEPPKASPKLCETCQLRPAVCAVGKGGHIGSVSICRQCWDLDWADRSDDGSEDHG